MNWVSVKENPNAPVLERLEPRELLSAAWDVVLIDAGLTDSSELLGAASGAEQVVMYDSRLESAADVLSRAVELVLSADRQLASLSIISHGAPGSFALGSDWISLSDIESTAAAWADLGESMIDGGEIYLYACSVAAERGTGRELLDRLADLTGADVFASDNITGSGGDWRLETASAGAESKLDAGLPIPFDSAVLSKYTGKLASVTNYRSIGVESAALYEIGTASVDVGTTTVTFAGGASLSDNIGMGDKLILDAFGASEVVYILSRDSDTQVTLQTDVVGAHGNVDFSISRAFNTIGDWETARQGNLVGDTRTEVGVAYNDGTFDELVVIDGSITDADHYMHLTAAEGQRHRGTAGTGAKIEPTSAGHAIGILDNYTRVEWMEITDWSTDTAGSYDGVNIQADNALVQYMLIHDDGNGSASNSDANGITLELSNMTATVRNSIVYNIARSGISIHNISGAELNVENCTVFQCTQDDSLSGSYGNVGRYGGSGTVNAVNVISMDADGGGADFFGSTWGASSNNISSDTTAPGANSLTNKTSTNQFASTDLGSEDLHVIAGSDAINAGTDLSGNFTGDIDGQTRAIGAA